MNSVVDSVDNATLSNGLNEAVIKVVGIGGGGNNALLHMVDQKIDGVEFICVNTDAQALKNVEGSLILQLGEQITRGLGAGANPEIGRKAAEVDRERIRGVLEGADMVFLTAGFGGGTGTGVTPVFAEIAHQLGILTVAVITKPFTFEGKKRMELAEKGIKELKEHVDSLITIPNNKLMRVLGKQVSLLEAFKAVNNVLLGAVQGIAELITRPGLINVDFADVKTVMSEMGVAVMGTGRAQGEDRAKVAARDAIASPLLEDIHLAGAQGILVNITAGSNLSIGEFEEVGEVIKGFTSENANVVLGTVIDTSMSEELRVTVVLTGLSETESTASGSNFTRSSSTSLTEDEIFDKPAILRRKSGQATENLKNIPEKNYLDVLNFVRRENTRSKDE